jgi:long-chain acyl-CoA synthetase
VVGRLADMMPRWKGWALRLFGRSQLAPLPLAGDILPWGRVLAGGRDGAGIVQPDESAVQPIDPLHDIALLQYTGGTTGVPKGAMLTHQNLSANARQLRAVDPDRDARDVTLGALPLFHVFANSCILNRTLVNGGCIAMLARFNAGQVLAAIARVRPTSLFVVPTMLQVLLDHPRFVRTDLSSLREIVSGGAPLPMPLKERFEQGSGVSVVEGYGLTVCAGVVSTNPLAGGARSGTIGQPLPATRVRLLHRDDPSRDAAPGEPGELAVLGPQVMSGYWNRPDPEAIVFAMRGTERWLRSGDIAVIDAEGYLSIVDRLKDMISVRGFKVYPSVVEAVLLQHPAVREALVIGVPDAYAGEIPRAYVTLKAEVTAPGLADWLNGRVGKHERVDAVVIRNALPKTAIGKLDRKALRAEIE